jgi:hypothetical protein
MIAVWPFKLSCKNCNVRVRLKIPRWQNIAVQVIAQFVFWAALIIGIESGLQSSIVGGFSGAVLAIQIALIPGLYAYLEVIPGRKHS